MNLKPNRPLTQWLEAATPDQRRKLAKLAKTSLPHLWHIANGRRSASAELAQRIAHAAYKVGNILPLHQIDLCAACGKCPLLNGK